MHKQNGRQEHRPDLAPIDLPIKPVELAGIVKREHYRRHEAKNVKMDRAGRTPAPGEDEESDEKVDQAYRTKIVFKRQRLCGRRDNH